MEVEAKSRPGGAGPAPGAGPARPPGRHAATGPVFVDGSGRRQRAVRRLGRLLVVPAAAYAALLISSALGGPTVSSPYLPVPNQPGAHGRHNDKLPGTPRPDGSSTPTSPAASRGSTPTHGAAGSTTAAGPAGASTAATAPSGVSPSPSAVTATATPTATATHGKSTATHPTPTRSSTRGPH